MRIDSTTGPMVIIAMSAAMLLASCGGSGNGPGDRAEGEGPSLPALEDSLGAAAVVREWDPCELLGDDLHELVEFMEYERFHDDLISSPYGIGTPSDLGQCMGTAIWTQDPDRENIRTDGLVVLALTADGDEAEAAGHYEEIVSRERDAFEEGGAELFAEAPVTGPWDEGVFLHGDYGLGDAFDVIVRDGECIIAVTVEADRDLDGSLARKFDLEAVKRHLLETTVPSVRTTVLENLETAGVNPGE